MCMDFKASGVRRAMWSLALWTLALVVCPALCSAWFHNAFQRRLRVSLVAPSTRNQRAFPALVKLDVSTAGTGNSPLNLSASDGSDLLFVSEGTCQILPHEVEHFSLSSTSFVWVAVDLEAGKPFSMWMYYNRQAGNLSDVVFLPATDVWKAYSAVFHFNSGSMLTSATDPQLLLTDVGGGSSTVLGPMHLAANLSGHQQLIGQMLLNQSANVRHDLSFETWLRVPNCDGESLEQFEIISFKEPSEVSGEIFYFRLNIAADCSYFEVASGRDNTRPNDALRIKALRFSVSIGPDAWHHIAVLVDIGQFSGLQQISLFKDGALQSLYVQPLIGSIQNSSFILGGGPNITTCSRNRPQHRCLDKHVIHRNLLIGGLDEFRIATQAVRDQEWFALNYRAMTDQLLQRSEPCFRFSPDFSQAFLFPSAIPANTTNVSQYLAMHSTTSAAVAGTAVHAVVSARDIRGLDVSGSCVDRLLIFRVEMLHAGVPQLVGTAKSLSDAVNLYITSFAPNVAGTYTVQVRWTPCRPTTMPTYRVVALLPLVVSAAVTSAAQTRLWADDGNVDGSVLTGQVGTNSTTTVITLTVRDRFGNARLQGGDTITLSLGTLRSPKTLPTLAAHVPQTGQQGWSSRLSWLSTLVACVFPDDSSTRSSSWMAGSVSAKRTNRPFMGYYLSNASVPAVPFYYAVVDLNNGNYTVTFTPNVAGSYSFQVMVNDDVAMTLSYVITQDGDVAPPPDSASSSNAALIGGLMSALVAVVLAVVLFVGIRRYRKHRERQPPDFTKWAFPLNEKVKVPLKTALFGSEAHSALLDIVRQEDHHFVAAIVKSVPHAKLNEVIKAVVMLYYAEGQDHKNHELIKMFISQEMAAAVLKGSSNLFRSDNKATKAMNSYLRMLGLPYLYTVVGDVVLETSTIKVELDPTRMDDAHDATLARYTLLQTAQKIFVNICTSLDRMPLPFRIIARHLELEVRSMGDNAPGNRLPEIALAGMVFLRFFCPAISAPSAFGIVDQRPEADKRRMLTLVTKTLQNLANGVRFGGKEPYMKQLNDFIDSNEDKLQAYFENLTRVPEQSVDEPKRVTPPWGTSNWCLGVLFRVLHSNLSTILPSLQPAVQRQLRKAVALSLPPLPPKQEWERSGWLSKQGGRIKTWKLRFFVLKGQLLWYCPDEEAKEPLGVISLDGCSILPSNDGFSIDHPHSRTYVISSDITKVAASSTQHPPSSRNAKVELQGWMDALRGAIALSDVDPRRRASTRRKSNRSTGKSQSKGSEGIGQRLQTNGHTSSAADLSVEEKNAAIEMANQSNLAMMPPTVDESESPQPTLHSTLLDEHKILEIKDDAEVDPEEIAMWSIHYTDDGIPYYYNQETFETTWDAPRGFQAPLADYAGSGAV